MIDVYVDLMVFIKSIFILHHASRLCWIYYTATHDTYVVMVAN